MLQAIEGFEGGGADTAAIKTYLSRRYSHYYTGGGAVMTRESGRFGGNAVGLVTGPYFGILIDDQQEIVIGMAVKFFAFLDGAPFLNINDNTQAEHLGLQIRLGGEIRLTRGASTEIETSVGLGLVTGAWYYLELKVKIDNAAGEYELRINGSTVFSDTGIDTQDTGIASVGSVTFYSTTIKTYYDDIYVLDTTGSINNDFLGGVKVILLSPDGDTGDADFTPSSGGDNYADVDEGVTVDDDTTYVSTLTDAQKDIYDYESIVGNPIIYGVQVGTEFRIDDANNFDLISIVKSGGTEYTNSAQTASANYTSTMYLVEVDPNTSALWTSANLNVAKFGFESVSIP